MSSKFRSAACISAVLIVSLLCACSGTGGMGGTGQMKLSVADAPLDGAQSVVVEFTGVELIPNSGNPVNITFAQPKLIDLLNQSGTASAILFDQPLPAGTYTQIRLTIVADGNASHSQITLSDGTQHPLEIPSGTQTGLKLVSGFTVPSSGVVDYTIDFNLRQSVTCPPGLSPTCLLQPALRLVDDTTVGNIQGSVSNTLVASGCSPGVYLYVGNVTAPEDMDSNAPASDTNQPISSVAPVATSMPPYYYQFTFLAPGTYTVAFTCQAASDVATQLDNLTFNPIKTGITVTAGQTTTVDFP